MGVSFLTLPFKCFDQAIVCSNFYPSLQAATTSNTRVYVLFANVSGDGPGISLRLGK